MDNKEKKIPEILNCKEYINEEFLSSNDNLEIDYLENSDSEVVSN